MPQVLATPFFDYEVQITPVGWQMSGDQIKKLLKYLDRQARNTIDLAGRHGKNYTEQCELVRKRIAKIIDGILSDDPRLTHLPIIVNIQGSFGSSPHFHEVEVEYRMD